MDDQILIELANYLKKKIIDNYISQGHRLTGDFESTLEVILKSEAIQKIIQGIGEYYAGFVDRGVAKSRIPFSGSGGGGKSKYIEGLKRFAEIKFNLSGREALGRAFAIAHTHKREGMPSAGSYQYSKTGKRTEFVTEVLINAEVYISQQIERWYGTKINFMIDNLIRQTQKII